MDKLERVIGGLKYLHDRETWKEGPLVWDDKAEERRKITGDAIAALKEREPVKPDVDVDVWKCGNCGHELEDQKLIGGNILFHEQYAYCPNCGRPVKWDD